MKQTLNVAIGNYDIILSNETLDVLFDDVRTFVADKKCLFVVSQKVYKLYKNIFDNFRKDLLIIKDGEKQKNFNNYTMIMKAAEQKGLTRTDVMVAVGGGVVGDIVGFAASTYMRGIDYIQVPTTLLSMVDSSVGGKTAINSNTAKNIIGSFYQPKRVFININFLKTLDKKQFISGLGEVLKYAFIENNCGYKHPLYLFEYLTLSCEKLQEQESMTLMRVIEYCLLLKISVVEQDEKESGLRKILNLGHTLAHALEALGGFKKFTHGEAVVQGIYFIFNYAYKNGIITYSYYRLATELLARYGFKYSTFAYSKDSIIRIMSKDKKVKDDKIVFIVPCDKKKVKEKALNLEKVVEMF